MPVLKFGSVRMQWLWSQMCLDHHQLRLIVQSICQLSINVRGVKDEMRILWKGIQTKEVSYQ